MRVAVDVSCVLLTLFSLLLEVRVAGTGVALSSAIQEEAYLLSMLWGRGLMYMVLGTFALTGFSSAQTWTDVGGFFVLGAGWCRTAAPTSRIVAVDQSALDWCEMSCGHCHWMSVLRPARPS